MTTRLAMDVTKLLRRIVELERRVTELEKKRGPGRPRKEERVNDARADN